MESWKIDELARGMYYKERGDMTKKEIAHYFGVSLKDADEIKRYYLSNVDLWRDIYKTDNQTDKLETEAREEVVNHCIAEWGDDAKRKIAEIQNEIYSKWNVYDLDKGLNFPVHSLIFDDFGQEKKVLVGGNFVSVMHEFADRINAELYLYYKYTDIVKKHRKDKGFCVTKEGLICKYLSKYLEFIASAYSFNGKELGFRYSLSPNNFKQAYRYLCFFLMKDSGLTNLIMSEGKIFEMACIHLFVDNEYNGSGFKCKNLYLQPFELFVEYGKMPWVEQKKEVLFAMVYFYCCYKEAYAALNKLVYSEKSICSIKKYNSAELEEIVLMSGNGYPKSVFREIKRKKV